MMLWLQSVHIYLLQQNTNCLIPGAFKLKYESVSNIKNITKQLAIRLVLYANLQMKPE